MAKRHTIQLIVVHDVPGITAAEIAAAITMDLNARGIILEQLLIEEVPAS